MGAARRRGWGTGTSASTWTLRGLQLAREHGVTAVRGSVLAVPLADGCADVVVAGEILEHVEDDVGVLAECARLLRPGGTLVLDALAPRPAVGADQRAPARADARRAAAGLHDPALFVDRARLLAAADRLGLDLAAGGAAALDAGGDRLEARPARQLVRMKPIRSTAVVFAGYGRKR